MAFYKRKMYVPRRVGVKRYVKKRVYNRFPRFRKRTYGNYVVTKMMGVITSFTVAGASSGTTFVGKAFAPNFGAFIGNTEYAVMYDRYKCTNLKFRWWWSHNTSPLDGSTTSATSNQTSTMIPFFTATDYDDSNPPSDQNHIQEMRTCKLQLANKGVISFKPAIKNLLGSSLQNSVLWRQWVDMVANDVNFYGLKLGFIVPTNAGTRAFNYMWEGDFVMAGKR